MIFNLRRISGLIIPALVLSACAGLDIPEEGPETGKKDKSAGYAYVFDTESVPMLCINVSSSEWDKLLLNYDRDKKNRDYVHCDVSFQKGSDRFDVQDCGLRLRGQTSRQRPEGKQNQLHRLVNTDWHHVHMGLHFRKFHPGDSDYDVKGVHRINLKYCHEDPTYVREMYCYDLLRNSGVWTGLECSYCKLQIHVEGDKTPAYYGVYLMQEAVGDEYLERRADKFGGADGFLWKCGWNADLHHMDDWRFRVDDGSTDDKAYELKTHPEEFQIAVEQLKDFIDNLQNLSGDAFKNWISKVCDVELLLRTYAANVVLGHWDDYWNDMNNFYIYFNTRDAASYKMYMICYDYDNTLGTSHNCGVQSNSGTHDPFRWGLKDCNLISKILSVNEYRAMYSHYLRQYAAEDSYFGCNASSQRIRHWQNMIEKYVPNDTGEDTSIYDEPASWSNHREYRLMSDGEYNWFRVKCEYLNILLY